MCVSLRAWAEAHTADELATLVPELRLEVLPLETLREHTRGLLRAALREGEGARTLRTALCTKLLPVLRESGTSIAKEAEASEGMIRRERISSAGTPSSQTLCQMPVVRW